GDYFTWNVAGEPLVFVRGDDGQVHALYNVCRHRGSLVCNQERGNARALVCPYHQWVYDTDGTLLSARLMGEGFDTAPWSLHRAHVRVCEDLIFVCLADQPPAFEPIERDIRPFLAPYQFTKAKICKTVELEVRANWKLIAENFRECYHCGGG